jgi:hypothetical protein
MSLMVHSQFDNWLDSLVRPGCMSAEVRYLLRRPVVYLCVLTGQQVYAFSVKALVHVGKLKHVTS